MPKIQPYPLSWPMGQPRTPAHRRRDSRFKLTTRFSVWAALQAELGRFSAKSIVITSNVPLRPSGSPYPGAARLPDPGVAAYFARAQQHYAIACDTYRRVEENARALCATLDAMRRIDRHGSGHLLAQALSGFAELPPAPSWWTILGLPEPPVDQKIAKHALRSHLGNAHPDRGGNRAAMMEIQAAGKLMDEHYEVKRCR